MHNEDLSRPRQRKSTLPEDMVADALDDGGNGSGGDDDEAYTLSAEELSDDDDYENEPATVGLIRGLGIVGRGRRPGIGQPRVLSCPKCGRIFSTAPCVVVVGVV
jgi:hypothetical protein